LLEKIDKEHSVEVAALKAKLIEKLNVLVNGKTSQGVQNVLKEEVIGKGTLSSLKKRLRKSTFTVNPSKWTTDKDVNDQILKMLLHNYSIKANDLLGAFKRKKFAVTVVMNYQLELCKWLKFTLLKNVN
jgi:DNA-directed RNA polymerase subunit beta